MGPVQSPVPHPTTYGSPSIAATIARVRGRDPRRDARRDANGRRALDATIDDERRRGTTPKPRDARVEGRASGADRAAVARIPHPSEDTRETRARCPERRLMCARATREGGVRHLSGRAPTRNSPERRRALPRTSNRRRRRRVVQPIFSSPHSLLTHNRLRRSRATPREGPRRALVDTTRDHARNLVSRSRRAPRRTRPSPDGTLTIITRAFITMLSARRVRRSAVVARDLRARTRVSK
jgi:hypothetical protein